MSSRNPANGGTRAISNDACSLMADVEMEKRRNDKMQHSIHRGLKLIDSIEKASKKVNSVVDRFESEMHIAQEYERDLRDFMNKLSNKMKLTKQLYATAVKSLDVSQSTETNMRFVLGRVKAQGQHAKQVFSAAEASVKELQDEVASLSVIQTSMQEKLLRAQLEAKHSDIEADQLEDKLQMKTEEKQKIEEEKETLSRELQEAEEAEALARAQRKLLLEERETIREEVKASLKGKIAEIQQELSLLHKKSLSATESHGVDVANLTGQLRTAEAQTEAIEESLKEVQRKRDMLEKVLKTRQAELATLDFEKASLESSACDMDEELNSLANRIQIEEATNARLEKEISDTKQNQEEVRVVLEEKRNQIEKAEAESEALRMQISACEEEIAARSGRISNLETRIASTESTIRGALFEVFGDRNYEEALAEQEELLKVEEAQLEADLLEQTAMDFRLVGMAAEETLLVTQLEQLRADNATKQVENENRRSVYELSLAAAQERIALLDASIQDAKIRLGAAEASHATTLSFHTRVMAQREATRLEEIRKEQEMQAKREAEAAAREEEEARLQALEAARLEAARLEATRLEAARLEAARLEAELQEAQRLEAERLQVAQMEAEREAERLAAEAAALLRIREVTEALVIAENHSGESLVSASQPDVSPVVTKGRGKAKAKARTSAARSRRTSVDEEVEARARAGLPADGSTELSSRVDDEGSTQQSSRRILKVSEAEKVLANAPQNLANLLFDEDDELAPLQTPALSAPPDSTAALQPSTAEEDTHMADPTPVGGLVSEDEEMPTQPRPVASQQDSEEDALWGSRSVATPSRGLPGLRQPVSLLRVSSQSDWARQQGGLTQEEERENEDEDQLQRHARTPRQGGLGTPNASAARSVGRLSLSATQAAARPALSASKGNGETSAVAPGRNRSLAKKMVEAVKDSSSNASTRKVLTTKPVAASPPAVSTARVLSDEPLMEVAPAITQPPKQLFTTPLKQRPGLTLSNATTAAPASPALSTSSNRRRIDPSMMKAINGQKSSPAGLQTGNGNSLLASPPSALNTSLAASPANPLSSPRRYVHGSPQTPPKAGLTYQMHSSAPRLTSQQPIRPSPQRSLGAAGNQDGGDSVHSMPTTARRLAITRNPQGSPVPLRAINSSTGGGPSPAPLRASVAPSPVALRVSEGVSPAALKVAAGVPMAGALKVNRQLGTASPAPPRGLSVNQASALNSRHGARKLFDAVTNRVQAVVSKATAQNDDDGLFQ